MAWYYAEISWTLIKLIRRVIFSESCPSTPLGHLGYWHPAPKPSKRRFGSALENIPSGNSESITRYLEPLEPKQADSRVEMRDLIVASINNFHSPDGVRDELLKSVICY
ncbi:hypothetical protein RRF57_009023 [Xylaria bambusicola]|uniref:Uncharacterized protein n=1 Tax=Xylaria bambusicola TaxID=326684 RepID=A0AAN7UT06_9PEZI